MFSNTSLFSRLVFTFRSLVFRSRTCRHAACIYADKHSCRHAFMQTRVPHFATKYRNIVSQITIRLILFSMVSVFTNFFFFNLWEVVVQGPCRSIEIFEKFKKIDCVRLKKNLQKMYISLKLAFLTCFFGLTQSIVEILKHFHWIWSF